jgi:prepilin-type N-terminal cleavage/methylation domain-containing protein/prepilin-type processing-associated H-X9-DG protein
MNAGPRRCGGFTLIELLVVIAIVAVLASLLVPVLSAARERSRTIRCLGNVRQIHVAFANYVSEQEAYPRHGYSVENWALWDMVTNEWHSTLLSVDPMLGKWTNQNSVFRCPSYRFEQAPIYGSYAYSSQAPFALGEFGADPSVVDKSWFVRESEIVAPEQMIEVGDAVLGNYGDSNWKGWDALQFRPDEYLKRGYAEEYRRLLDITKTRHNGRYNIAFCDGHIEAIAHVKLFSGDEDNRRRWAYDHQPHLGIYDFN